MEKEKSVTNKISRENQRSSTSAKLEIKDKKSDISDKNNGGQNRKSKKNKTP